MAQITETNAQYYQGSQGFRADGVVGTYPATFDTGLVFYSSDPADINYARNNFKVYTSATGLPGTFGEVAGPGAYTVADNVVNFGAIPPIGTFIVIQLKTLDGGKYGLTPAEKAYGETVEDNYGGYQYVKLNDIVNNFMVGYVGDGKVIQTCKKSDVIFFAKRSLQEFSYDTLKSIKSSELTIPESLSLIIPQDYVNYVNLSWIDRLGVKHPIYPANN